MGLETYRRKRDFRRTPEPAGGPAAAAGRSFTIQRHHSSRLHYDFRLELGGVLKSWAVPKGPSLDPSVKRMAVEVEDHPVEYGTFEGQIPKGEYGGGTVVLWDRGEWTPVGDARAGLAKGHLRFRLKGRKLSGLWDLVRTRRSEDKPRWLLIKAKDEAARAQAEYEVTRERPESVAEDKPGVWKTNRPARPRPVSLKRPRSPLPKSVELQLCTLVAEAPEGAEWLHEVKFDGYRALCRLEDGQARLITRGGQDWTTSYAAVASALQKLAAPQALLDGEIVALDARGASSFQRLQQALKGEGQDLVYYAFDLLFLDGRDLRGLPLQERKEKLKALLCAAPPQVRYSDHVSGRGPAFHAEACRSGLEGIVCKRADAPYEGRRSRSWLKVKCLRRQELVIGGWTDPSSGTRSGFGALLLGYHEGGKLLYAGKVGTGFDEKLLRELRARLDALARESPAFAGPPRMKGVHWVEPRLVAEIAFGEWTNDGKLRHPRFVGLRLDKPAREVVRERTTAEAGSAAPAGGGFSPASRAKSSSRGFTLTSPGRVLYPEVGITKRDLQEYYLAVADQALLHLARRPLAIVRCPEGRHKSCFFQKHPGQGTPAALRSVPLREKDETLPNLYIEDLEGLMALVQIGALEVHPWGCRVDDIEKPDLVVFDLDPAPDVSWQRVKESAVEVRELLDGIGLTSFLKTTGGKGLHIVAPLERGLGWDDTKAFTKLVVERLVRRDPSRYTAKLAKSARGGRIFVDYLRNGRGATAVGAFSTRARPGAPVALPVSWEALAGLDPAAYTIKTVPRALAARRRDPWRRFGEVRQSITPEMVRTLMGPAAQTSRQAPESPPA